MSPVRPVFLHRHIFQALCMPQFLLFVLFATALQLVSPLHLVPRLSWLPFTVQVVLELLTVAFEASGLGYFANVISTLLVPVGVAASKSVPLHAVPLQQDHCKTQRHLLRSLPLASPPLSCQALSHFVLHCALNHFALRFLSRLWEFGEAGYLSLHIVG